MTQNKTQDLNSAAADLRRLESLIKGIAADLEKSEEIAKRYASALALCWEQLSLYVPNDGDQSPGDKEALDAAVAILEPEQGG